MKEDQDDYEQLYKIIIIGDSGVGKSNILGRYLHDEFKEDTKSTVGVEFGSKKMQIESATIKLQIWDTAGQERYRSITSAYYKGAKGAFIVYDITRKNTFDNIDKWISDLKLNGDQNICIIILGNKSDLNDQREVSKDEAMKKAELHKTAFLETSAYNGDNIAKAFDELIEEIYKNNKSFIEDSNKKEIDKGVNLNDNKDKDNKKCCGSS